MNISTGVKEIIWSIGQIIKREKYPSNLDIKKRTNRTISYINDIVRGIEKLGLIKRKKKGTSKLIEFTEKGWMAYNSLETLKEVGLE